MAVAGADRLRRLVVAPSWLALAAVALLAAVATVPLRLQFLPLVASAVVLGIPHGALDHVAVARASGRPVDRRSLAVVGALYAGLGGATLAAWLVAPVAAFAVFILVTWLHWGQGDRYSLVAFTGGSHLVSRGQHALAVAARGALPMLVPLAVAPDQYRLVARACVSLFDPGAAAALDPAFAPSARAAAGALVAGLVVAHLAVGRRRSPAPHRDWRRDAGETLLLAAYFVVVPPILAVGWYFAVWHAARHVARLVALDPGGDLRRFAVDAAPLSAVALALLAGVAVAVPHPPGDLAALAGAYLVLLSALTVPHTVVVALMDRAEGVSMGAGSVVGRR
jgi:Brp/Blh family beta-carotene 15,15'-monooxygenase